MSKTARINIPEEEREWVLEQTQTALKAHMKRVQPIAPGYESMELDEDVKLYNAKKGGKPFVLPKGIYFVPDMESDMKGSFKHFAEGKELPALYTMNIQYYELPADDPCPDPTRIGVEIAPIRLIVNGEAKLLTLDYVMSSKAYYDLWRENRSDAIRLRNIIWGKTERRRERKKGTTNETTVLTNTLLDNRLYSTVADESKHIAITASGTTAKLEFGNATTTVRLTDLEAEKKLEEQQEVIKSLEEFNAKNSLLEPAQKELETLEKAERRLRYDHRFWLNKLYAVVKENNKTRVYGSDLLKRAGYKKPLRPNMSETMRESWEAVRTGNTIKVWMDTTEEALAEEKRNPTRAKRLQSRTTEMPLVAGNMSLETWEDGTSDWFIDLTPRKGKPITDALPLYEYAEAKGQVFLPPSRVFDFAGCNKVTLRERKIMEYVYTQAASKGTQNSFRFETMHRALGIADNAKTRAQTRKTLERLLPSWVDKGIIKNWTFKQKGRAYIGFELNGFKAPKAS